MSEKNKADATTDPRARRNFIKGCHRPAGVALHVADEHRAAAALRAIAGAFCIRGFVMATVGYLKIHPNATRHERPHGAPRV